MIKLMMSKFQRSVYWKVCLLIPRKYTPGLFILIVLSFLASYLQFQLLSYLSEIFKLITSSSPELTASNHAVYLSFFVILLLASLSDLSAKYLNSSLSADIGSSISVSCYQKIIGFGYSFNHIKKNKFIVNLCVRDIGLYIAALSALLSALSSTLTFFAISFFLIKAYTLAFLVISSLLLTFFALIALIIRPLLIKYGEILNISHQGLISHINYLTSYFPYIYIRNLIPRHISQYSAIDSQVWRTSQFSKFLHLVPKPIIEFIVLATSVTFIIVLTNFDSATFVLSTLGILAIALQKMIPTINTIYYSLSLITSYAKPIANICSVLEKNPSDSSTLQVTESSYSPLMLTSGNINASYLRFHNVNFMYPNSRKPIISSFDLLMPLSKSHCIYGPSGHGKSTLLKLIAGLIYPQSGTIELCDKNKIPLFTSESLSWPAYFDILYQNNFISTGSAEELFDTVDQIDLERLSSILNDLKLLDTHKKLLDLANKPVFIDDLNFSGGQIQRLNLASVLYSKSPIVLLDEPTSALDTSLSYELLQTLLSSSIYSHKTFIFITHDKNLVSMADYTYDLSALT